MEAGSNSKSTGGCENQRVVGSSNREERLDLKNNISELPLEILYLIFKELNVLDLLSLKRVAKITNVAAGLVLEKKMNKIQQLIQQIIEAGDEIKSPLATSLSCKRESPAVLEDSAILLAQLGQVKSPYNIIRKIRELGLTSNLEVIISRIGRELVKTGNIVEARHQAALAQDPIEYLIGLSEAQSEIKDFEGAEETLDLLKLDPLHEKYDRYLYQMAIARAKTKNFTKAEDSTLNAPLSRLESRKIYPCT